MTGKQGGGRAWELAPFALGVAAALAWALGAFEPSPRPAPRAAYAPPPARASAGPGDPTRPEHFLPDPNSRPDPLSPPDPNSRPDPLSPPGGPGARPDPNGGGARP